MRLRRVRHEPVRSFAGSRFVYGLVHPGIFRALKSSLSAFSLQIQAFDLQMTMLDKLRDPGTWNDFYEYKTHLACPKAFARQLRAFTDTEGYLPVCEAIARGEGFPLPRRSVISKLSSQKKRTVYTYPDAENTVLKLLTYLLLRKYDGLFSDGLYSFRPGRSAKDAIRRLIKVPGIGSMWSYKVDIHDYFNSVPVDRLLPMLKEAASDDPQLYGFLASLLTEERVLDCGREIKEDKGIMAGTPLSAFYANLYLKDLDRRFADRGIPYSRYSDDIIVFAATREEAEAYAAEIKDFLKDAGLSVNPAKEHLAGPEEGWTFLGFSRKDGVTDIAEATVLKLKHKMRRKARALKRWADRNGHSGRNAAAAFIRVFNRKLLETSGDSELSWSYWFFPVITTVKSLQLIDSYAQDCLRYLISGTRTKARYNVRYEDLKALGYRSLVHEYYAFAEAEEKDGRKGKDVRA